ncbi:hypothetical protein CDEST_08833 [Colletotrichum destructivum]|uniref:Uncharacterized protein n=1 Tax=Colletotrichum destructivum TaxID=34406 RepID=A0AAX4IKH8_9PEZI|nr:hypothetical protein CDEST_08833 [Colletotrichum destructivum]
MEYTAIAMDGTMNATVNTGNILEARILATGPSHLIKKRLADWPRSNYRKSGSWSSRRESSVDPEDLAIVTSNMPEGRYADECTVEEADDDFSLCTNDGSPRYNQRVRSLPQVPCPPRPGPRSSTASPFLGDLNVPSWRLQKTSAASSPPSPRSTCLRSLLSMTAQRCRFLDLKTTDAVLMNDYTVIKEADGEICFASFVEFIYIRTTISCLPDPDHPGGIRIMEETIDWANGEDTTVTFVEFIFSDTYTAHTLW